MICWQWSRSAAFRSPLAMARDLIANDDGVVGADIESIINLPLLSESDGQATLCRLKM